MRAPIAIFVRRAFYLTGLFLALSVTAETTVGLDFGSDKQREHSSESAKRTGGDAGSENKDKTEKSKSVGVSISDETVVEQEGNYSKTETRELDVGRDKKTTTDNKTGENKDSSSYSIGYDDTTEKKVTTGDSWDEHIEGEAGFKYGHGGELSYDTEEGLEGHYEAGVGGHAQIEGEVKSDKMGGDAANVTFGAKGKVKAEVVAKLEAAIQANKDGIAAKLKGKVGASVGVSGEISAEMELLGIPVTVKASGEASVGAELKGSIGAGYDAKTGKLYFEMEAGAVLGAGASGKVTVEVGWDQVLKLADDVGNKIIDKSLATFTDIDPEYIRDLLNTPSLNGKIEKIIDHELQNSKRWKGDTGKKLLENVLGMIDKGAEFGTVYKYIRSLVEDNYQQATEYLNEIRDQISGGSRKEEDDEAGKENQESEDREESTDEEHPSSAQDEENSGSKEPDKTESGDDDPFNSAPETSVDSPSLLDGTILKGKAKGSSSRRATKSGGGGNTSSKIW